MALYVPEYLQTKTYSAQRDRYLLQTGAALQEGVVAAFASSDYFATQRSAGANMSVDVAFGNALVAGDDTWAQGLYHVVNDNTVNVATQLSGAAWANGDPTNPRIDQVVLQVNDTTDGGRAADNAVLGVVQGTATAGATLDNRNGAAVLPGTCMRICDVLVPAAGTSVTTANIRDRRPWARGIHYYRAVPGSISNSTTTPASLNVATRVEFSASFQLWCRFSATLTSSTANTRARLWMKTNGAALTNSVVDQTAATGTNPYTLNYQWQPRDSGSNIQLASGSSFLLEPYFSSLDSVAITLANYTFEVWEVVGGAGNNGTS